MKSILQQNKKGSSLGDTYVLFMFFIVTLITAGISIFMYNTFQDGFSSTQGVEGTLAAEKSEVYSTNLSSVLDPAIIVWFIILWLGSLVTSAFLDNSPVWFIIFFIASLISLFALAPFANIISDLSESELKEGFDFLPMSMYINNNLLVFVTVYMLSIGLVLFIKRRTEG